MENIDNILARPYRRVLIPDAEAGGYTAFIEEFPGCIAEGDTGEEALRNLESVAESWLEAALELGQSIPDPQTEQYSGRVALRLPKSIHRRAVEVARAEDTSLNQFLVSAIAERLGHVRGLVEARQMRDKHAATIATLRDAWDPGRYHAYPWYARVRTSLASFERVQKRILVLNRESRPCQQQDESFPWPESLFDIRPSFETFALGLSSRKKEAHAKGPSA